MRTNNSVGGGGSSYAFSETPSGTKDGANTTFTLANAPSPAASLLLTLNGQVLAPAGVDFTLSGSTITMINAPISSDVFLAISYLY